MASSQGLYLKLRQAALRVLPWQGGIRCAKHLQGRPRRSSRVGVSAPGGCHPPAGVASTRVGVRPTCGAACSRLSHGRGFANAWLPLTAILFVAALLAGCGGNGAAAPQLPIRAPVESLDPHQLGDWVRANVTAGDFREPFAIGLELDARGDALFLRGVVDEDSYEQVYDVLNNELRIGTLVFTMVPGSVDDDTNLALGRMLRQAGIVTYLPSQGTVASGGTDLFLSGVRRIVERGARVGVHSWSTDDLFGPSAVSLPRDHPEHAKYLDYYRDMGIPEAFYWFTLRAAPPDDVHWMTEAEMETYRVYTDLIR